MVDGGKGGGGFSPALSDKASPPHHYPRSGHGPGVIAKLDVFGKRTPNVITTLRARLSLISTESAAAGSSEAGPTRDPWEQERRADANAPNMLC